MSRYTESIYVYETAMDIWSHQPIVYTGYIIANIYRKCTFVYKYMFMQTVYIYGTATCPCVIKTGFTQGT